MKCPFVIKICTKCNRLLVAWKGNFKKNKGGKWGLYPSCKECDKLYREKHKDKISEYNKQYYEDNKEYFQEHNKQYREEHKDKIAEYQKQYYEENKEEIVEKKKQYYEENKDKILEHNKQYYEENKDKILEHNKQYKEENKDKIAEYQKQYYEENKDKILEHNKQYKEENPHIKFNSNNKRRQLEKEQGRDITKEQWLEMMNFFDWCCAYSGEYIGGDNADKKRTTDHIIPISKGGLNEPWNCVPMLKSYNSSKRTNNMEEWYIQQEFYSEERLAKIYVWCKYAFNKWKPRRKGNKKIIRIS